MKYVQCYTDKRSGWFRIFGFGLSFRNIKKSGYELTFSQRHGYTKYVKILGYVITFLKRQNMATRIKETPVLSGKDAKDFVRENREVVKVSTEEKEQIRASYEALKSIAQFNI